MIFSKLSDTGKNYITQLHEEAEPYFEKIRLSNKKFAERLRQAMEFSKKELSKNKNGEDSK
jgi:hypothetical protein